ERAPDRGRLAARGAPAAEPGRTPVSRPAGPRPRLAGDRGGTGRDARRPPQTTDPRPRPDRARAGIGGLSRERTRSRRANRFRIAGLTASPVAACRPAAALGTWR